MAETKRIVPAEKIKTDEEAKSHFDIYKFCRDEQKWLKESKDPKKEIADKLKLKIDDLSSVARGSNEESTLLGEINGLQVKLSMLLDGTYETALKENISTEAVLLQEFELEKQMHGIQFLKALFKRDENAKKLWDIKVLRLAGRIETPTSLNAMGKSNIYKEFLKSYNNSFVELEADTILNNAETSLTIYNDQAGRLGDGAYGRIVTEENLNVDNLGTTINTNLANNNMAEKTTTDRWPKKEEEEIER